jgi:large subunit ribosomal protein L2
MILKQFKPTTPSKRQLLKLTQKFLSKKPLLKSKITGKKNSAGKNHSGKITVYHRGGGVKNKFRDLILNRNIESTGIVCSIEHDPNRNSYITSIYDYANNKFFYVTAPQNIQIGDIVKSGLEIQPSLGSSLPLSKIPVGTSIYNISMQPNQKAKFSRSAGTFSTIKKKTSDYVIIELSSKEQRDIPINSFASIGKVSKKFHSLTRLGKAGQSRWLNIRPTVRGVAMNPIDHPHGGGEGKKSGRLLTPWGKSNTRKTRKNVSTLVFKKR